MKPKNYENRKKKKHQKDSTLIDIIELRGGE